MYRHWLALALLSLSACGDGSATYDAMAATKWANTPEKCTKTFTTFDNGLIRLHYPDGTFDFGKIVIVGDVPPSDVMLTVEPTKAIRSAAKNKPGVRLPDAVTMDFQLKGKHLHLRAMLGNKGVGGPVDPKSIEYRLFNLSRCSRSPST